MSHFVMTCEGEYPSAAIDLESDRKDPPWYHGRVIKDEPQPLVFAVEPKRPGNLKAMYDDSAYPLMRDDLVEALRAAGVDNLQLFDAVIRDPVSGKEHTNYKAFNIVGLVSAADMDKSLLMGTSDSRMIDTDFDSLAIDEKKAAPHKLFRLAENVSAIIVDEVVKQEVERRRIPGMLFYDPADWSG